MSVHEQAIVDLLGRRKDDYNWRGRQAPLPIESVDRVLLLQLHGKIGDSVIQSALIDGLVRLRPELEIAIGTTPEFAPYWRLHEQVARVATFPPRVSGRSMIHRMLEVHRAARPWKGRFDLVVSFASFPTPDHFLLLRTLAARVVVGFDKNQFRLFDYSLEEGRLGVDSRPIGSKVESVLKVFGAEMPFESLEPHVPVDPQELRDARSILDRMPSVGARIMLHTYGEGRAKRLDPTVAALMVVELRRAGVSGPIFLGVPAGAEGLYGEALHESGAEVGVALVPPTKTLSGLFALISLMDGVIAPDTSIGHVAAALGKPQIAIFSAAPNVARVWKPRNERCAVVVSQCGLSLDGIDWREFSVAAQRLCGWAATTSLREG